MAEMAALLVLQKVGCLLFTGRGRLTRALKRRKAIELIGEAKATVARLVRACSVIGICLLTLKRWRKAFLGDGDGKDRRKVSSRAIAHRLSEEERQRILLTCNQPEYAALPPGQIVPALADQKLFIGSESSFYRVLYEAGQCHRRRRARLPQEPQMKQLGIYDPYGLVFVTPTSHTNIYDHLVGRVWHRSLEHCGLKPRRLYAQRHSFLSHALAIGNSPADLAAAAGHSTKTLLDTYAKPTGRLKMPSWQTA